LHHAFIHVNGESRPHELAEQNCNQPHPLCMMWHACIQPAIHNVSTQNGKYSVTTNNTLPLTHGKEMSTKHRSTLLYLMLYISHSRRRIHTRDTVTSCISVVGCIIVSLFLSLSLSLSFPLSLLVRVISGSFAV
jgi:hypothetical protein